MIPRRAKSWLIISLALCLFAGGVWITLGYNRSISSELPVLAPESGKPPAKNGAPAPRKVYNPLQPRYTAIVWLNTTWM